jgi:hypothetical protein
MRKATEFDAQLLTGKTFAQSELAISILPAEARAISGHRAIGVRLKNAFVSRQLSGSNIQGCLISKEYWTTGVERPS